MRVPAFVERARQSHWFDPDAPVKPYARAAVWIALVLMTLGLLTVYSATGSLAGLKLGDPTRFLRQQLLSAGLGVVAVFVAMRVPHRRLLGWANPALFVLLGLLVLVLFVGSVRGGARRWLTLGGYSFQPSELAKLVLVVWLARHLALKSHVLQEWRKGVFPAVAALAAVVLLVLPEPDLGTAIFLGALGAVLLVVGGVPFNRLLLASMALAPMLAYHVYDRWDVILRRFEVVTGAGATGFGDAVHQVRQALIALGSGGVAGQGLGAGLQKLNFLPEARTDFILPVLGEETGFIGTAAVVLLFAAFVLCGLRVAIGLASRERFGFLVVFGLVFHVGLQAAGNIAVVTGSVPTKGIALPFISLGGSSLLMLCASVGLLYSVAARLDAEWAARGLLSAPHRSLSRPTAGAAGAP